MTQLALCNTLGAVNAPRSRVAKMVAALRRLGGNLWMVENAFAGAFVDNVGTTPVTAVADLIGLITDKSYGGQLGVELLSGVWNNSYVNTFDTFTSTSFGGFTGSTAGAKTNVRVFVPFTGSVSDFYEIRFNISMSGATCKLLMYSIAHSGLQFIRGSAGVDPGVVSGEVVVRCVLTASGANGIMLGFDTSAGGTVTVTSASSRKVPGNHATQSAVASKPRVQRVPKRLGPNLVVNGTFDANIDGWTSATGPGAHAWAAGTLRRAIGGWHGGSYIDIPAIANRTYQVGGSTSNLVGSGGYTMNFYSGGGFTGLGASILSGTALLVAQTNNIRPYLYTDTIRGADFDNIEVREVLEWANVISFDGSNDFLQTGITTGNEGFVAAGVTVANHTSNQALFGNGAGDATIKGVWMAKSAGASAYTLNLSDGAGGLRDALASPTIPVNTPCVIGAGWSASTMMTSVDLVETQQAKTKNPTHTAGIALGGLYSFFHNGNANAFAICSVYPSAADRTTIRNGIAALQGRTL